MQNQSPVNAQNVERREGKKNYVFVDEHNRHKRLKVMRACQGCRKRKIKCDSATTNIWPCAACTRLKLVCAPPSTTDQDYESTTFEQSPESERQIVPPNNNNNNEHIVSTAAPQFGGGSSLLPHAPAFQPSVTHPNSFETTGGYIPPTKQYFSQPHRDPSDPVQPLYLPNSSEFCGSLEAPFRSADVRQPTTLSYLPVPHAPPFPAVAQPVQPVAQPSEQPIGTSLTDAFGELKIDETGIAPYLRQQKQSESGPEAPVQDECALKLPPPQAGPDHKIRFPIEFMPSDSEFMNYFQCFFDHIHPYVPVVHKAHFYQQWHADKWKISPLLLVAVFACAGRMIDPPNKPSKWLAWANKYESEFMEAPRLSTVQALLLLLKAREAMPKKGYYYRSWQTIKTILSMAKDLDLHEHYDLHMEGKPCGSDSVECLIRTRVWQTIAVVEIMIGGPQGRSDFGVDPDSVEVRPNWNIMDLDSFETERSRQFAYFVRNALNVRRITDVYHKLKKQKDWGADPNFVKNNYLFSNWLGTLPPDLQVSYPPDGSPPWLPSHFVGNMHSHFNLAILILHRPQLVAANSFPAGGEWRTHMSLCYSSAKSLCRLQEAVLSSFGLPGLLYMQRGISFTIYGVLTSVMLHLIAITSPDPEFHTDARSYFTRHMRILEQCSSSWPMAEIQSQLDALRLAFSADTSKPFELKPSFPYGNSPEVEHQALPSNPQYNPQPYTGDSGVSEKDMLSFSSTYPISPPVSTQTHSRLDSASPDAFSMMPSYTQNLASTGVNVPLVDENNWNPSRIITQWDMAFAGGITSKSPSLANTNVDADSQSGYPTSSPQYATTAPQIPVSMSAGSQHQPQGHHQHQQQHSTQSQQYDTLPVVMNAREWQRSVASVYDPEGAKRRWQSEDFGVEGYVKKRRG